MAFVVSRGGGGASRRPVVRHCEDGDASRHVAKIEWINPHVVLTLDVRKDNGSAEQWFIALSPPSVMIRRGIKRDAIKEGATMSVTGYVATTAMLVTFTAIEFTMPDGRSFATGNAAFNPIDTSSPRQLPVQKK